MANNNAVYQQMTNVSIPRDRLMWLAADDGMSKKAYKVMLCLFTQLDGYNKITQRRTKDPQNFKMIDFKASATDAAGLIGEGTHQRAVITVDRFMDKCQAKLG